jgi:hypothetical protein
MSWCEETDVQNRLKAWEDKGIPDDAIQDRIDQAERFLKTKFLGAYATSTVTGWDDDTPPMLKDLCAIVAAVYLKDHFIDDYKMSSVEKEAFKLIDQIAKGQAEIIDSGEDEVGRGTDRTKFNNTGRSRTFSTGNVGDDTFGEGTLDDFGPNQEHIEGEY